MAAADNSIAFLQQKLADKIAALENQRKEEAALFEKKTAERAQLAEAERQRQLAEYQEQQKKRDDKRKAEEAAAAERAQTERATRIALENSLAAAEEARKLQESTLQWLVNEINKQEFIEEQYRKSLQTKELPVQVFDAGTEINVEHPEAPLNVIAPGEAVQGIGGETQTPVMSDHLKKILRQATRA